MFLQKGGVGCKNWGSVGPPSASLGRILKTLGGKNI